jgi:hypothetical protein
MAERPVADELGGVSALPSPSHSAAPSGSLQCPGRTVWETARFRTLPQGERGLIEWACGRTSSLAWRRVGR